MKTPPLWRVSVAVASEAEEATAALLERLFGQPASVYAPEDKPLSIATVYLPGPADQVRSKRAALDAGLAYLEGCGLKMGDPQVTVRKVPREDWSTSWRKYFKVLAFGEKLLIRPSWSRRAPRKGQAVVTLDPGLSFGTGQHATTSFCLRQLVDARVPGQSQSFLDIGTGSGILAIAAVKLGYHPVRAFDNDPVAVRVAKANAGRNRVAQKLTIVRQELADLSELAKSPFDFACANLVHDLLTTQCTRILGQIRPGGLIVLSGILVSQFAAVAACYEAQGCLLQVSGIEGEWKSGLFRTPGGG